MFSKNDFWMPKWKYEFVEWLERHYSKDKNGRKINWNTFPLKRLRAIYIGIRKDYENANETSKKSVRVRSTEIKDRSVYDDAPREDIGRNPVVQSKATQICFSFGS